MAPSLITAEDLGARLLQACERAPGLAVVAADNMAGEFFAIDTRPPPTIYYDGTASILNQRRYLVAAVGVLLAEPEDRARYLLHVLHEFRGLCLCEQEAEFASAPELKLVVSQDEGSCRQQTAFPSSPRDAAESAIHGM